MTRRSFVAGNWKMNGSAEHAEQFARALLETTQLPECELAVCAPFVYIERLARLLADSPIAAGAQDLSATVAAGAYTGEVSGAMLADCGTRYVIVGHSERRALHHETDDVVAAKADAASAAGLVPIICVGESLDQRESDQTEEILARQVSAVIKACRRETLERLLLAYEPIWAIGTGRSATPEQAQSVHASIRACVAASDAQVAEAMPILYGGSVKPDNAASLFAGSDVDGALVGGASLDADSFIGIARALG